LRRMRSEGAVALKSGNKLLYTVYRNKNDELIAFEQPARKCAELMGVKVEYFRQIVCYAEKKGYTIIKTVASDEI